MFCPWKYMLCVHTGRSECVSVALVQFRGRWRTAGALQGIATWQEHTYSKTNRFAQYFYESLSSAGSGRDDLPSPREAAGGRSFQLSLYLGSETWVTSSQSWRESPWATCHTRSVTPRLSRRSTTSSAAPLYSLSTVRNVIASDAAQELWTLWNNK